MNFNNFNFSEISFDNIGGLPAPVRYLLLIFIFMLVLFFGYWFHVKNQINDLDNARDMEDKLTEMLEIKIIQAQNLEAYRSQLQLMIVAFQQLLQKLPTRSEVPGLLEDITRTGRANGLEFILFKPLPDIQKAFYSELPIKISVVGDYHQIGKFVSEIAGLDRIVTLHDFVVQPISQDKTIKNPVMQKEFAGKLLLDITAKTYRYTGVIKPDKPIVNKHKAAGGK